MTSSCTAAGLLASSTVECPTTVSPLLENNITPFYIARNMDIFGGLEDCMGDDPTNPHSGNKATIVQLVISLVLGLSSFIAFCVGRPILLFSALGLTFSRYCDRDGSRYMQPASGRQMLPRPCQSYRIRSWGGFRCCLKSQSSKFLRLLAWMLMSYVIRVKIYLNYC